MVSDLSEAVLPTGIHSRPQALSTWPQGGASGAVPPRPSCLPSTVVDRRTHPAPRVSHSRR